jgi:HNH endonuclease
MPRRNSEQDFWSYMDKSNGENSCWIWKKSTQDHRGYGQTYLNGKHYRAHRLAFLLSNGYLPEAVCHKCDNPSCCNPKHLFPGTNGLNNTDRHKKGRSRVLLGEDSPNSKLSKDDILSIRHHFNNKLKSAIQLGNEYGVHRNYIYRICKQKNWKHI